MKEEKPTAKQSERQGRSAQQVTPGPPNSLRSSFNFLPPQIYAEINAVACRPPNEQQHRRATSTKELPSEIIQENPRSTRSKIQAASPS
eukprot:scaffold4542_cov150-Skeletonema_dohrnii-CCMP3373.AAC.3